MDGLTLILLRRTSCFKGLKYILGQYFPGRTLVHLPDTETALRFFIRNQPLVEMLFVSDDIDGENFLSLARKIRIIDQKVPMIYIGEPRKARNRFARSLFSGFSWKSTMGVVREALKFGYSPCRPIFT